MWLKRAHVATLALILLAVPGCRREVDRTSQLATTLREIVEGPAILPVQSAVWADVRMFYGQRENAPAWVSDHNMSDAAGALQVLQSAPAHGFAPADYGEPQLSKRLAALQESAPARTTAGKNPPDRVRQMAELDARLTTALLAFGRDVAVGRMTAAVLDQQWKPRRELPDLVGTLNHAADGDLKAWIDTVRPKHPEYAALQEALVDLHWQREKGGWQPVPAAKMGPGRSDPAVVALRHRLAAGGHLTGVAAANTSLQFSSDDEAGVKAFQALHALPSTGVVDESTLAAMNVTIDDRISQVELNLERWRWMQDDFGARHLLVNIPYFHLVARENGKVVKDIRVVVGKPTNKTPVFSSVMSTLVFSPYWNIPSSIVEGETAPAAARDPGYLAKNNMEILDGATPVDATSIDWNNPSQRKRLSFRQRPGPGNALGYVKFLFPNEFDVYVHDTPSDRLFARPRRALSHGCVRVEEPEALAKYVLRGDSDWDDTKILQAMHAGEEKHVRLKETIPIHIVYFTAWVDENGGLHFQPDVYGYDAHQADLIRPL